MQDGNQNPKPGGFNFGQQPTGTTASATPTGGFSFGASTIPSTTGGFPSGGGISFGKTPASGAGFPFGAAPAATTTAGGFGAATGGFGAATGGFGAATGGFSFNTSTPTVSSAPKSTVTPTVTADGGFSFGASAPGLQLGSTPVATSAATVKPTVAAPLGFSFGIPETNTATTGLTLGAPGTSTAAAATATTTPAVIGQMPSITAATIPYGQVTGIKPTTTTTTATPSHGFQLGAATTAASTSMGLLLTPSAAKPVTTGLTIGVPATTAPPVGFGAVTTSTPGFGQLGSTAALPSTIATQPSSAAAAVPARQITYRQLEDTINKWTTELSEQEKIFLQQATQVNAWDRLVMENGEKIIQLSQDVEKVKTDQQKLDHELDFIHSQQKELEDLLQPLEKSLDQLPPISFQQHADLQREHTYQLAESIDAQMKRMGQDLKETIERLNATNSKTDPHDPVQQITKILNAHMDSLLWIDRNSATLYRRVEDISKEMDTQRKEQERNYRLVYN